MADEARGYGSGAYPLSSPHFHLPGRQTSAGIGTGMDKNGGKSRGFFESFICLFVFCIYDDDLLLYGFIE